MAQVIIDFPDSKLANCFAVWAEENGLLEAFCNTPNYGYALEEGSKPLDDTQVYFDEGELNVRHKIEFIS